MIGLDGRALRGRAPFPGRLIGCEAERPVVAIANHRCITLHGIVKPLSRWSADRTEERLQIEPYDFPSSACKRFTSASAAGQPT